MVGGFGRFIKADATTKMMMDIRAFHCQITLESLDDIPENLSIVLGEELFTVMVHLESWERVDPGEDDESPAPPQNEPGFDKGKVAGEDDRQQDNGDEVMEDEAGELDEVGSRRLVSLVPSRTATQRNTPAARDIPRGGGQSSRAKDGKGAKYERGGTWSPRGVESTGASKACTKMAACRRGLWTDAGKARSTRREERGAQGEWSRRGPPRLAQKWRHAGRDGGRTHHHFLFL